MQNTLLDIIKAASSAVFNMPLRDFIKAYPSQVALIGLQIIWTQKLTDAFERTGKGEKSALEGRRKEIIAIMDILSAMCLEDHGSSVERLKVETMVTIHVH